MAQGTVTVNNLNLAQGASPEIERKALFIGVGATNVDQLQTLNSQSDLDDLLGEDPSEIKIQVSAAKANGGENWEAYAIPQAPGYDWTVAVDPAMQAVSVELIVLCTPATSSAELDAMQAEAERLRTQTARRVIVLTALPDIDSEPGDGQTWGEYITAMSAIVSLVAAYRVACVPLLHGNDLGVLAGRLCNRNASIADSPMRIKTGSLINLGLASVDSNGDPLTSATLSALDELRLSVPQRYIDYPGVYWGDCNLLDAPEGDYQVIEYLRPVDKAARKIRLIAIPKIADRALNNTPISIASNENDFSRPLREMSRSTTFNNLYFPGEIKPPEDDAVTIVWRSNTDVEIYLKVQPYNSPKSITANVLLDLVSE